MIIKIETKIILSDIFKFKLRKFITFLFISFFEDNFYSIYKNNYFALWLKKV